MDHKNCLSPTSPENQEDGDEEALSLCDLPISGENPTTHVEDSGSKKIGTEDFEFGSLVGSVSAEPEMCAADEVFSNGQILPFRHSVSSDAGFAMFRSGSRCVSRSESMEHRYLDAGFAMFRSGSRCASRSESMDHRYSGAGGFVSSRSSSIRSHNSSSSGSSNSTLINNNNNGKQRLMNRFHSHPSPSPQIRSSGRRIPARRSQDSTVWSLFRVGLVQPPEIEFESLKFRNTRNCKSLGSSRNSTASSITINLEKKLKHYKLGFLSSCKCSVDAIDTVPLKVVTGKRCDDNGDKDNANEGKDQGVKKNKQALSRHRTFEWLKDLSLIGDPDES